MSETIYVELHHEGTPVWRPVEAQRLDDAWYRITSSKTDLAEEWAFQTGDVVRCEFRELSEGTVNVAVAKKS